MFYMSSTGCLSSNHESVKSADFKLNFWPGRDLRTHVLTRNFGFLMTIFFGYIQINVQENKVIN